VSALAPGRAGKGKGPAASASTATGVIDDAPGRRSAVELGKARETAAIARAALRKRAWTIAAVLLITALSWPFTNVKGSAGLDSSWIVGLSLAVAHGLSFGEQVIFTYGPLGFSLNPVAVAPGVFFAGEVLGGLIQVALVAVLLVNLRRRMGWIGACLLTLIAASLVGSVEAEPLTAIAFGLVALALTTPAPRAERAVRMLAIGGGALAAFTLLVKLNDGVGASAIVTVGVLGGTRRRRDLALEAASLLTTLVALWLILGQPLGALPDYLHNGYDVVSGYVEAMGHNELGSSGEWQVLLLLGSALALGAGAWTALPTDSLRRRWALVGAVMLVHYFVAREIFVRYDAGHLAFLVLLVAIALMIPWRRDQRTTGLAVVGVLLVVSFTALRAPLDEVIDPLGHAHQFLTQTREVLEPGALIREGRVDARRDEAVPRSIGLALRGHCVTAEPVEITAVWAHPGWRWCPLPVFQSYTAYTTRLDRLNAEAYADARDGPDRVLRQLTAIDGRSPTWESPLAMLSLLCHFTEIEHGGEWQALARVPDRCGTPHTIAVIHSSLGQPIALPSPPAGTVVVAAIDGLQVAGWERLETLFTRARPRYVTVNGTTFRVPPGTAADGLVIAVPADADYAPPFNLNMDPHTLRVTVDGHSSGPVTVRLSAIPIAPSDQSAVAEPAASEGLRADTHHLPWLYRGQRLLTPTQILSLPAEERAQADSALLNAESLPLQQPSAEALRAAVPAVPIRPPRRLRLEQTPIAGTPHGCTLLTPEVAGSGAIVSVPPGQGLYFNMRKTGQVSIYEHRYAARASAQPVHVLPTAGTPAVLPFPPDASRLPWQVRLVPTVPTAVCLLERLSPTHRLR
jgi:hypothetical protein